MWERTTQQPLTWGRGAPPLTWFTGGFVLAALLGVYLSWTAWVLPAGLGCLAGALVCRST